MSAPFDAHVISTGAPRRDASFGHCFLPFASRGLFRRSSFGRLCDGSLGLCSFDDSFGTRKRLGRIIFGLPVELRDFFTRESVFICGERPRVGCVSLGEESLDSNEQVAKRLWVEVSVKVTHYLLLMPFFNEALEVVIYGSDFSAMYIVGEVPFPELHHIRLRVRF